MYEKENASNGYQIRTRQYSNMNLREEHSYEDKIQKRYGIRPNNKYQDQSLAQNYAPSANSELTDKYGLPDRYCKDIAFEQRQMQVAGRLNRGAANERDYLEEISLNSQNKRQNARKHELEMRMNNINTINDKINSLLSLVKRERVDCTSKERPPRNDRTPSPAINREKVAPSFQHREETVSPKTNLPTEDFNYAKRNNKSIQRLRALSTLSPTLANKQLKNQEGICNARQNEEDYNKNVYYPPSNGKYGNQMGQKIANSRNYEERFESGGSNKGSSGYSKYSPIKQTNYQGYIDAIPRSAAKHGQAYVTPVKQKFQTSKGTYQHSNQPHKIGQPASPENSDNIYLPMTIIANQNHSTESPTAPYHHTYSGMRMIDDQIRRIKERIGEQYNDKYKQSEPKSAKKQEGGKNMPQSNEGSNSKANKFQLKVYPVKNDKPETIKIAQKLCYQIQIDNRMRKGRETFLKMEEPDKWKDLSDRLSKNTIRLTASQLKTLLTHPSESFNQYSSEERVYNQKLDAFAQELTDAQKFWEKYVVGCAGLKALRREGFDAKDLDLNGNGHLNTDGLLNFVNEYTGHSYKASDLLMVFGRLQLLEGSSSQDRVEYSTFMQAFAA